MKGRERMGSPLPPASQARRDSVLFKKMKCIFSIAPVGKLDKSRECFSLRNTHRTLASRAPDAASERPVQTVPRLARVRHRMTGTGRRPVRPVVRVWCEICFAELSEFKSGEHRMLGVRPVARFR